MSRNYIKYNDEELVVLLKGDKPESDYAFAEIYDRYGLKVNAYIRTILGDRDLSEDVFQETFIKFYQNVKSDFNQGSLIGFLIRIARNLCLNVKRDKKPVVSLEKIELPSVDNFDFENKEFNELLAMALDLLDQEFREPIVLRFFDDLPYEEISKILGVTSARARYLVYTGKQKLREYLNPFYQEINNN